MGGLWLLGAWVMGVLVLVIALLVFAVYYVRYRSSIRRNPATTRKQEKQQSTIHRIAIAIFVFLTFLVASMLVMFMAVAAIPILKTPINAFHKRLWYSDTHRTAAVWHVWISDIDHAVNDLV